MWFIRAIVPIGAAVNILIILTASYWFSGHYDPPFAKYSVATALIYLACVLITVKEALCLAVLSAILSTIYFLLVRYWPGYDFPLSGYAFTALFLLPLMIVGMVNNKREEKLVREYFLLRQTGSVADVRNATQLSADEVQVRIDEFIKDGKLEVMLENPMVYKWTEQRDYPEGMQTTVLDINV